MKFPALDLVDCAIVQFEQQHLTPRYVSWLNDPEVVRYSEQRHKRHTLESCGTYLESFRDSNDQFLAIESRLPHLGHIGNIGVAIDANNRVADVSIIVGEKRAWGTGLASSAWCAVVAELIERQNMRKVTAGTMAVNHPMVRLMARSGMRVEATRPKHFLWEGYEIDLVCGAVFARIAPTFA